MRDSTKPQIFHFKVKAMVRNWDSIGEYYERDFSVIVAADSDGAIVHAINNSGFEVERITFKELQIYAGPEIFNA